MAITGLLVHTLQKDAASVEKAVALLSEMTSYGVHQGQYVVVVVEAPSDRIEKVVEKLDDIDGVLSVYTTYLTVEDEIDDKGDLQTSLSMREVCKQERKNKIN